MYPYSHFLWAHRMRGHLGVEYPGEFNLGAVVADLRYVDGHPWEWTHFADSGKNIHLDKFWALAQGGNGATADRRDYDFALGYLLHLAMDDVWPWMVQEVRQRHPLGRLLPPRILKLSLEVATIEAFPLSDIRLTHRVPPLAVELGISPETIRLLREYADEGLSNPDIEKAYAFVQNTNLNRLPAIRILMFFGKIILHTPLRLPLTLPMRRILRELEPEIEYRILGNLQPFVDIRRPAKEGALRDVAEILLPETA